MTAPSLRVRVNAPIFASVNFYLALDQTEWNQAFLDENDDYCKMEKDW